MAQHVIDTTISVENGDVEGDSDADLAIVLTGERALGKMTSYCEIPRPPTCAGLRKAPLPDRPESAMGAP